MTQLTRVFKVDQHAAEALEHRLRDGLPVDAEWRTVPYARFAVKALGVVLTCYTSGKLVIQGRDLEVFCSRFVSDLGAEASGKKTRSDAELSFDGESVGSDEAGKGDYFGPLVVAACHAPLSARESLSSIGVTDSKALSDQQSRRLAGLIQRAFDHEIVTVDPPEYNQRHAELGNLNLLLAEMHARAINQLLLRNAGTEVVVVDRFGRDELVAKALNKLGSTPERLVQVPRAERHPVVAAASILARAAFLDGLARCSDASGTDLHKGAGAPADEAARRVQAIGGRNLLGQVAKLHFKNTERLP